MSDADCLTSVKICIDSISKKSSFLNNALLVSFLSIKTFRRKKKPICYSVTSLTPLFFCYFFLFCFLLRFWYLRFLSFFSQYPLLKRSQNIGKVMHAQLKLKYAIKIKWGKEGKKGWMKERKLRRKLE